MGFKLLRIPLVIALVGLYGTLKRDQESIVVMLDWNHARERIVGGMLDGKTLRLLERASCVITDVRGSSQQQIPTRKVREQFLIGTILGVLAD